MIPLMPKNFIRPMCIGNGAFATVYRVWQSSLDRWVAVKIIDEKDQLKRETILKEAKVQAKLQMDHILQIYDAFEWKKKVYIVMEWIEGVSLTSLLTQNIDDNARIALADSLIHILARLHELGYAHRDIKPDNIVISPARGVYLVDFAFAKHVNDKFLSKEEKIKGTPAYMAPELWRGEKNVDYFLADLYSVGMLFKELLTNERWDLLINKLTNVKPDQRQHSAKVLLEEWKRYTNKQNHFDWSSLTTNLFRKLLAENLVIAAKELLSKKRCDEAYWLLVESLENNPDNPEILSLIGSVGQLPEKNRFPVVFTYILTFCVAVVLILMGFFYGRKSVETSDFHTCIKQKDPKVTTLFGKKTLAQRNSMLDKLPFLAKHEQLPLLSGKLYLVNYPDFGHLLITTRGTFSPNTITNGIILPGADYSISWRDSNNTVIWKEKIVLLPFQKKVINMPSLTH